MKEITMTMIESIVCDVFALSPDLLKTKKRAKDISLAKHVVCFISRKFLPPHQGTFKAIGMFYDIRHATVIYACNKVSNEIKIYKKFSEDIQIIEDEVKKSINI